jgi:D-glycero-beta-D-manno-heptose-7-phosphate kinase
MGMKLRDSLEGVKDKKVLVIGDLMLDRNERGIISKRKNPENENVPIILAREEFYLGGCGNVARNLSSLGIKTDLYGIIGRDLYGHQIKEMCKKEGICTDYLIETEDSTILKARIFIEGKYKHRSDLGEINERYEKNLEKLSKENKKFLLLNLEREITNYNGIILSDYNKKMFSEDFAQKIIYLANSRDIPVVCDPKPENIDYFKFCSVVCPNKEEAQKITGENELFKIGQEIQERINSKHVIITCGKEGAFVYDNGKSKLIKTKAKKVVEVTGAGDTFAAVLTLGLISKLDIFEAAELANVAAGLVVEKIGTAATGIEEILKRIEEDK